MSNAETNKRLERLEKKIDLLLGQKFDASEKLNDANQGQNKKAPVRRRTKALKMADYETMYRRKGIM